MEIPVTALEKAPVYNLHIWDYGVVISMLVGFLCPKHHDDAGIQHYQEARKSAEPRIASGLLNIDTTWEGKGKRRIYGR